MYVLNYKGLLKAIKQKQPARLSGRRMGYLIGSLKNDKDFIKFKGVEDGWGTEG